MTLAVVAFLGAAAFAWWLGTGALLLAGRWRGRSARWSVVVAATLVLAGAAAVLATPRETTVVWVGVEFLCALAIWGWVEATFYAGVLTGPGQEPLDPAAGEWARFTHALRANLYHELAIVLAIGVTWLASARSGASPGFAPWAVAALAVMHESARLNVLLGVRNLNIDLLPEHLAHFRAYFRLRNWNAFYPWALVGHGAAAVSLGLAAAGAADSTGRAGLTLMAGLVTLGLLEHAALMLPFRPESLWGWAISTRARGGSRRATGSALAE